MAFLNRSVMLKKAAEAKIELHPLLKDREVPLSVRIAYLQGCVLAVLLDDAVVSSDEKRQIKEVGKSLQLSDEDIANGITVVQGLKSDEDQATFLDELHRTLGDIQVFKFFMSDFERLMAKPNGISDEAKKELDEVGSWVGGVGDWRQLIRDYEAKLKAEEDARVAEKIKQEQNRKEKVFRAFREKTFEVIKVWVPESFEGSEWARKDYVRECRDSFVCDYIAKLGDFVEVGNDADVDIERQWNLLLCVMKRKYVEERPDDDCYEALRYDRDMFFKSIWFLVILAMFSKRHESNYYDAVSFKDILWLMEAASDDGFGLRGWIRDHYEERSERFIWRLLTVASRTIGTEPPPDDPDGVSENDARYRGWWN